MKYGGDQEMRRREASLSDLREGGSIHLVTPRAAVPLNKR